MVLARKRDFQKFNSTPDHVGAISVGQSKLKSSKVKHSPGHTVSIKTVSVEHSPNIMQWENFSNDPNENGKGKFDLAYRHICHVRPI